MVELLSLLFISSMLSAAAEIPPIEIKRIDQPPQQPQPISYLYRQSPESVSHDYVTTPGRPQEDDHSKCCGCWLRFKNYLSKYRSQKKG